MSKLTKQQIAQRRNYFKFVLTGMPKPIDKRVLTATELSWWETMLTTRNEILKNFDNSNVIMGLKSKTKENE